MGKDHRPLEGRTFGLLDWKRRSEKKKMPIGVNGKVGNGRTFFEKHRKLKRPSSSRGGGEGPQGGGKGGRRGYSNQGPWGGKR